MNGRRGPARFRGIKRPPSNVIISHCENITDNDIWVFFFSAGRSGCSESPVRRSIYHRARSFLPLLTPFGACDFAAGFFFARRPFVTAFNESFVGGVMNRREIVAYQFFSALCLDKSICQEIVGFACAFLWLDGRCCRTVWQCRCSQWYFSFGDFKFSRK